MSSAALLPINIAPQPFVFFPGNSVPVQWSLADGLTWNTPNPVPVTDATGTLTILDPSGTAVPGADGIAFSQTDTPGTYQANIDGNGFTPGVGSGYKTVITFTSESLGGPAVWTIATSIRLRTTP